MLSTFTFRLFHIVLPLRFMVIYFAIFSLSNAAQSQNTTDELEEKMQVLYRKAHQLYANLPNRDYRGNYFTMAVGISPFGHLKTWKTEEVCDCSGNVVGTKDVSSVKFPMAWTMGWENRLNNSFSFRLTGSYAYLTHAKGRNVVSQNGDFTQMRDNYELQQFGLQASVLLHIDGFYAGSGVSRTSTRASGFKTESKAFNFNANSDDPPQYLDLEADLVKPEKTDIQPHLFVGYRLMWSPDVFGSVELGFGQNLYFNFQLNIPLSPKVKKSLKTWQGEHQTYITVLREAVAIDRYLHPQKFTPTCTDIDSGSSGGCSN
jgi:hypothetical protein